MKMYTAQRENGWKIEEVESLVEGMELIKQYEEQDKHEGTYEEDYYEVVNESGEKITQFVVELTDQNGATSPIDTVEGPEGYTAEQYVRDCEEVAGSDEEWIKMLHEAVRIDLVEYED